LSAAHIPEGDLHDSAYQLTCLDQPCIYGFGDRKEIASSGVNRGQLLIVSIMEEEGLLPSELADKTSQNRPAITGILDRLEKNRLINKKHINFKVGE
jgi:DNA-binding MarR family transcriptional regulator